MTRDHTTWIKKADGSVVAGRFVNGKLIEDKDEDKKKSPPKAASKGTAKEK